MIVPSIDLQDGQTVQLIGGVEKALDAGDPRPLADRFGRVGEIAVIDLDAAMGKGSQASLVEDLLGRARCRVGGGIRDVETAIRWLDAGAAKIILGTAARPDLLRQLPKDRVVVALDAHSGEVVVDGWQTKTGVTIEARLAELREFADHFLITFVEREGRLGGIDLARAAELVEVADGAHITFAGGVTTAAEVAALDAMGADAQVGMALYRGLLDLTEAFAAPFVSDRPDGLWPTVVQDVDGTVLGLCYSSLRSLQQAIETGRGTYESRRRGIWVKGETSGDTQDLLAVDVDCDRDALRFLVRQRGGGFCHRGTATCFVDRMAPGTLSRRLQQRIATADPGSYTRRLLAEPDLLAAKLREEAGELAAADRPEDIAAEAADLLYFASVALARQGVGWDAVYDWLERRARKVTRRPGDAKPEAGA